MTGTGNNRALTEPFAFLSAIEVALGPAQVCRSWTRAGRQEELWKNFYYKDFPFAPVLISNALLTFRNAYRIRYYRQARLYSFNANSNSVHIYNLHHRKTLSHRFAGKIPIYLQSGWKVLQSGDLFVCGGLDGKKDAVDSALCIIPHTWQIEYMPPLINARASPGIGEFQDYIYVFGGIYMAKMTRCERYNKGSRKWSTLPSMPSPKYLFSPIVYKEKFWLIDIEGIQIEEFDPDSLQYRFLYVRVPGFTNVISAIMYGDKALLFGLDRYYILEQRGNVIDGKAKEYDPPLCIGYSAQITEYHGQVFLLKNDFPVPKQLLCFDIKPDSIAFRGVILSPDRTSIF